MRIGLAMAMVLAGVALVSGCGTKDRLYESTPVPQPAASVPSAATEETVIHRPAVVPEKVRLAHMTEAELARLILESLAAAHEALEEEDAPAIDQPVGGEKTLHAELVR